MIYKCKMCGGELDITGKEHICECPFCGVTQTIPNVDEEKTLQLYNRATFLLKLCEYDKASSIYEKIISDQGEQAEAYWGLCLCKYGIEYVDDPKTGTKIPTCHRTLLNSILKDSDYLKALELADIVAKKLYEEEAKYIDGVQKKILEISKSEEPYDIFICYKETDKAGKRTPDSVIAEEIFDELAEKGYKVFFSKISLEDKIGQEYEPYIFAALTSAKVMLAIGTREEYFNAPWVKNEWSRFLKLCNSGEKKYLIPCYKDISPYEMPDEFVNLQSQDLGKLGYLQDLTKGIDKLLQKNKQTNFALSSGQDKDEKHCIYNQLRQMLLSIKNGDFNEEEFISKKGKLELLENPFGDEDEKTPLSAAISFLFYNQLPTFQYKRGSGPFKYIESLNEVGNDELELYREIKKFIGDYLPFKEEIEKKKEYEEAFVLKKVAANADDYEKLYKLFERLGDFKDAKQQAEFYKKKCDELLNSEIKEYLYVHLIENISYFNTEEEKAEILSGLKRISDYKDVNKYIESFDLIDLEKLQNTLDDLNVQKQNFLFNNTEIQSLKSEINKNIKLKEDKLIELKMVFDKRVEAFQREIIDLENEKQQTQNKLKDCSVFAIKERKMLKEKISFFDSELLKLKRENKRNINELDINYNVEKQKAINEIDSKIKSIEEDIQKIIETDLELCEIDKKINEINRKIERSNLSNNNNISPWNQISFSLLKDTNQYDILLFKLGRYPKSLVKIPYLCNILKTIVADKNNIYHYAGLKFYKEKSNYFLIEPIIWRIVNYNSDKNAFLLVSNNSLDRKSPIEKENIEFDSNYINKSNGESIFKYKYTDIRQWLNANFYDFAFNHIEKQYICKAVIDNSPNTMCDEVTRFDTDETEDYVFLTSYRACKKMAICNECNVKDFYFQGNYGGLKDRVSDIDKEVLKNNNNVVISNAFSYLVDCLGENYKNLVSNGTEPSISAFELGDQTDFAESKEKRNYKSFLLRSPNANDETGYNTFSMNSCRAPSENFKKGKFEIKFDIAPFIIFSFNKLIEIHNSENFDY